MTWDRYKPADMTGWQGRVDSEDNYDAFRWHQWISGLDLRTTAMEPLDGLGFALLGFVSDEGVRRNHGRTGAAKGPEAIRKELANLPCTFSQEVQIYDAGNVYCQDGNLEESQEQLAKAVCRIRELNLFPLVLGGGHETALGHYAGHRSFQRSRNKTEDIAIINFDAHFDLRPFDQGGSSGTMFRQIAQQALDSGENFRYFCLGVQMFSNTRELFKVADQLGAFYIPAKEAVTKGEAYVKGELDRFMEHGEQVYVTICADVFSSAFAPGVSATQPLGLDPEDALSYLRHIIETKKLIGFDIAEVSPRFDQDSTTASLAKVLIFSVVNNLCRLHGLQG